MVTDVVYSKFTRGFETYQKNTGKRHPLQPDSVSAGTKRDIASEDLLEGWKHYWMGMYARLEDWLCLMMYLIGSITVGTPPVSEVHF